MAEYYQNDLERRYIAIHKRRSFWRISIK